MMISGKVAYLLLLVRGFSQRVLKRAVMAQEQQGLGRRCLLQTDPSKASQLQHPWLGCAWIKPLPCQCQRQSLPPCPVRLQVPSTPGVPSDPLGCPEPSSLPSQTLLCIFFPLGAEQSQALQPW